MNVFAPARLRPGSPPNACGAQSAAGSAALAEYQDDRDDDLLWATIRPDSEPTRRRAFLPAVLALVVLSIPWYLPAQVASRTYGGLPLWVWITLGASATLAALTSWASLRWWSDDAGGEEKAE